MCRNVVTHATEATNHSVRPDLIFYPDTIFTFRENSSLNKTSLDRQEATIMISTHLIFMNYFIAKRFRRLITSQQAPPFKKSNVYIC